jgi:hypothetical protein
MSSEYGSSNPASAWSPVAHRRHGAQVRKALSRYSRYHQRAYRTACGPVSERFAIIDVARREQSIQQFTSVIDHQVQFEAKEPACGGLASPSRASKYLLRGNALVCVQADIQGSAIYERNTGAVAQAGLLKVSTRRDQRRGDKIDKGSVTDQARELAAQMRQDILTVMSLEVAVDRLKKVDQDSHRFENLSDMYI